MTSCCAVAEQGKLKDPKVFEQQVRRMLASDRSRSLVTNFASEWLKLRDIDTIDPDPFIYPNFDPSLRTAFRREAGAVRRQHPARGPQRAGSADGQLYLRQRAPGAALRHSRTCAATNSGA